MAAAAGHCAAGIAAVEPAGGGRRRAAATKEWVMTITQIGLPASTNSTPVQAQSSRVEHARLAKPRKIGPALAQLAEAIQTAKRAGMTCAELSTHMAIMWPAVPVEDCDDDRR
jgi:hypothetical protein